MGSSALIKDVFHHQENVIKRSSCLISRTIMIIGVMVLGGWAGLAEADPWGLDQRPENISCIAPDRPSLILDTTMQRVFENLSFTDLNPISMSQPPNDPSRWFIAMRQGQVFSFANDNAVDTKQLALDISDKMVFSQDSSGLQWGITSVAFHPEFPVHPYLFVQYNVKPGIDDPIHSVVTRFTSSDGGQTFDSSSEQVILTYIQETGSHNMGQMVFGLDGYLYIGLGDGGKGARAQDLNDLRGSILRIDIDQGGPYTIPPDNPLVGTGFREEIYAWGLRNPWRFTIDRGTGELWLGDVGSLGYEEINRIEKGGNYGWHLMEGGYCRKPGCDTTGLIPPVLEIPHPNAAAVIGGYVYRGSQIPSLQGVYIFGDGAYPENVRGLFYDTQGQALWAPVTDSSIQVSGFAEALDGEVYTIFWATGEIYKLVEADSNPPVSNFPELLSETGCVDPSNPAAPASGLIPFTVNSPLWSDGAGKKRWMALPDGETIGIGVDGGFEFPVGTVLMKEFAYGGIPIETRLLVRHDDGAWGGYSYEWKDDLSDAVLLPAGKSKQITPGFIWKYPGRNECLQCHTDAAGFSLGPEIAQLNGSYVYPSTSIEANQLNTLNHIGMFTDGLPDQPANLPALVAPKTSSAPVERKARSYIHSNCSGCHRPGGPVPSNLDFRYSTPVEEMNACDVIPNHGDLGIANAKLLTPGNPMYSIMSVRPQRLDVNRMPPLGTAVVDTDGTGIIDAWINQADVCTVYPDTDADLVRDNVDNCTVQQNRNQRDSNGDGYGNMCDADFDQSGLVNSIDLGLFKNVFFSNDPDADLNGDGIVNSLDLGLFKQLFFKAPGPSAL